MKNLQKFTYRKNIIKPEFPYLELSDNPEFKIYIYLLTEKEVDSDEYISFFKYFCNKYDMTKQNFQKTLNRIADNIPDFSVLKDGDIVECIQRGGRSARSLVFNHVDRSITRRDSSFIISFRDIFGKYICSKSFKFREYTIEQVRQKRDIAEEYFKNAGENATKEDLLEYLDTVHPHEFPETRILNINIEINNK